MRLLLDSCVWGKARDELSAAGHDVVWSGSWPEDPGDEAILAFAQRENRAVVTLDKDFGELAIVRGQVHCGILRLVNVPARQQAGVCLRVVSVYGNLLEAGAIITAETGRLRVRPPDSSA